MKSPGASIRIFLILSALATLGAAGCDMAMDEEDETEEITTYDLNQVLSAEDWSAIEQGGPSIAAVPCLENGLTCDYQFGDNFFAVRVFFFGPTIRQYRAGVICTNGATRWGPWFTINSGSFSRATCATNTFVTTDLIQTRTP